MTKILTKPIPAELRNALHDAVSKDLLGPAGGAHEIVDEPNVRGRYILGLLAPKGQSPIPSDGMADDNESDDKSDDESDTEISGAPEEEDDLALGGPDSEDGQAESPRPKAASLLPSSIGLTFTLAPEAEFICITARWGRYQRIEREVAGLPPGKRKPWQRKPVEATSPLIPLREGRLTAWSPDPDTASVIVDGRVRRYAHGWTVTLYLVNGQSEPRKNKDEAWVFQPELNVTAHANNSDTPLPLFRRVLAQRNAPNLSAEDARLQMLYRKQVEFGVGHGVAVHATLAQGRFDAATAICTITVPAYEVWPTRAMDVPTAQMDMQKLAALSDADFAPALQPLLDAYSHWITAREQEVTAAAADLQPYLAVARQDLTLCRNALLRMTEGLNVLQRNAQAAAAFRFANQAMAAQRLRTEYARKVRKENLQLAFNEFTPERLPAWRPFQLAFVLLNLASLADPLHSDRNTLADVLWFPTGGGKTEAYLGLTAFALAIRRLQGVLGGYDGRAGVTVLMRYTLRLLTLQQFQRAITLICACEEIRRTDEQTWGAEPFRIGLWVGSASTPNSTDESYQKVNEIRRSNGYLSGGTPHQLTTCPYCGQPINPGQDIVVESYAAGRARTLIYCGDASGRCLFSRKQSPSEGLPVLVVDEEIYRRLPALLIATVDKFAQLPWKGETQMLFGKVNGYCPRHGYRSPEIEDADSHPKSKDGKLPPTHTQPRSPLRPPDLIIQDELHLINGPLGTLVGLYETAIDALCTWSFNGQNVKPKIIASSATIRRTQEQVRALYTREARVFPPTGLDARDSFFAQQVEPTPDAPGRRYIGLSAPGTRTRALLIRLYIANMAAAQQLANNNGEGMDPWLTLVGYFNSLRELGSMRRAVEDTVSSRLRGMSRRGLAGRFLNQDGIEELTSRRSAADIPIILDKLELPFDAQRIKLNTPRSPAPKEKTLVALSQKPIDVLLATNMISVGVDVDRLGLMVVANQPKSTAEYIQATSRIGRRYPGLVCMAYNWARPRDLSHYERFEHYHATFYQQVEALSVTPFSPRALDRGLTALLVAAIRLAGEEFNANLGAGQIDVAHPLVTQAIQIIEQRAQTVSGEAHVAQDVAQGLQTRLKQWVKQAKQQPQRGAQLGYKARHDNTTTTLLKAAESLNAGERDLFTCLNSLRDVELTANLVRQDFESDDEQRDEELV